MRSARPTTTTRMVLMPLDSKAKARAKEAKEEKAKESATSADHSGKFRESALNYTRAKAKAEDSIDNATSAEKLDIQPAGAPRPKEMKKEPGAKEDTKEPGAREDSRGNAKISEKLMAMKHKEILIGTSRQRSNRVRIQT